MWRLRNRLIVSYLFIGVIPIRLLLLMAGIGSYLFAGQFANVPGLLRRDRLRAEVTLLSRSLHQVRQHLRPNEISIAFTHDVGTTEVSDLFRMQSCVNAAKYDPSSTLTRHASDLHASQSIAGVDSDAHYVPRLDAVG